MEIEEFQPSKANRLATNLRVPAAYKPEVPHPGDRAPTMKSLLTKILLALIASAVLALLLTTILSHLALRRGFVNFLDQQEEQQLHHLVPELAEYHGTHGSWDELAQDPRRWMKLLARSRPEGVRPPEDAPPEFARRGGDHRGHGSRFRRRDLGAREPARQLWRRIFLLDENRELVAGALPDEALPDETLADQADASKLVAIVVDEQTVGWVGFRKATEVVAPEARRFLKYQAQALALSLLIALAFAAILAYWLARSLSGPAARLRDTVQALTEGRFDARAAVESRDEIGALAGHVNLLAETLEKNETARRRWTADIAHELRTPLAVLQGELEAVKDGVRPWSESTLRSLIEEVAHLGALVEDLQTLALADAGALRIQRETFDLAGLLRQVLSSFAERFAAAGLRLEIHLPEHFEIDADRRRLRQLIHNLLDNSRSYTQKGGVVHVRLYEKGNSALLEIEDTAPGVAAEDLEHLFERFYRAEPTPGSARGGTGLGLAICRNIVIAHEGEIHAEASPLGGLLIRVSLPRHT